VAIGPAAAAALPVLEEYLAGGRRRLAGTRLSPMQDEDLSESARAAGTAIRRPGGGTARVD